MPFAPGTVARPAPSAKVGSHFGGLRLQLGKGHFIGAVNGNEQVVAAFFRLHFRKIDV
jgi:hypothetical protein